MQTYYIQLCEEKNISNMVPFIIYIDIKYSTDTGVHKNS